MSDRASQRLDTERLVLRHAVLADAQTIFDAYASDPEATKYLVFETLTDVSQASEYIERTFASARKAPSHG